jgi:acetoin utilization protein AcuB
MVVGNIMRVRFVTVSPETSYEGAAKLMNAESLPAIMVVDKDGKLVGILSEKDLFRAIYPDYGEYFIDPHAFTDEDSREARVTEVRKNPIHMYMSKNVRSVHPETHLMIAGGLMLSHHLHQLPVVEDERIVGIVSREYLFKRILRKNLGY